MFTLAIAIQSLCLAPALAEPSPSMLGTQGATPIPFAMPGDGRATVALYTPQGRLVRILVQVADLPKGEHTVRWDGMDLWGNLVPAGTELVCKIFINRGLRAFYEFTAGEGDRDKSFPPWLTRPVGEGLDMRTGGWLADHTGPGAAVALGDRIFFGSRVAEHGHALMATDTEGRKLWGINGLEGWQGPAALFTNGKSVFAWMGSGSRRVYRIDPATYEQRLLFQTERDPILALAVHEGKVALVLRSMEAQASPFRYSVGHGSFDFAASSPQMLGENHPDYQISQREMFSTVFHRGGHFQTGIRARPQKNGEASITAVFTKPVHIGTLLVGRVEQAGSAEFYALKPGQSGKTEPSAGSDGEPADGKPAATDDENTPIETEGAGPGAAWALIGKTTFPHRLSLVTCSRDDIETGALHIRLIPRKKDPKGWSPTLAMCRILEERVERLPVDARLVLPTDAEVKSATDSSRREAGSSERTLAWRFRSANPASESRPVQILIDLGERTEADGVMFLNHVNPIFTVQALTGPGDPAQAPDAEWTEVARYQAPSSRKDGYASASTFSNEYCVVFAERIAVRALRLVFPTGHLSGRNQLVRTPNDPHRFECDDVAFLRLVKERPDPRDQFRFVWQERNAETGDVLTTIPAKDIGVSHLAFLPDGRLVAIEGKQLCRLTVSGSGVTREILNEKDLVTPQCLTTHGDRIVVGDSGRHAVLFLDTEGRLVSALGDRGGYSRGPWDPDRIERPGGVAIDRNGKIWIAEPSYAPKRIARFAPNGRCEKEIFGPPEYGGGGYLDPDLKSFYYRGMEFSLDWENGISRLKNLNDRCYTEETPALEASTFAYTRIGCPIYLNRRKYIVGSGTVCLMDGPVWRPCAVMGPADGSVFLLRKESWKKHWENLNLTGKGFIWCDRNEDGKYQVEEVEVFPIADFGSNPFDWGAWGVMPGPDLTFWSGSAYIPPSRFTEKGVPIYEVSRIRKVRDSQPPYLRNVTFGMRAKPEWSGFGMVTADGSLIREGQPSVFRPDGTYRGGPLDARPSDYLPPIRGEVIEVPLNFVGSAATASPVGEVAVLNGNNGVWSVVSVQDCVLLDQIFTGRDGNWSTDLREVRGMEVTGRRHDTETFFGHFVKAHNGNYYTVAGKGFHGICRIEGLDDCQIQVIPVRVTAEDRAVNEGLRTMLVGQQKARDAARERRATGLRRDVRATTQRFAGARPEFDGWLREWGVTKDLEPMDACQDVSAPPARFFFDAAYDDQGLYLAYRGYSPVASAHQDPVYLFKTGFAFDFQYRSRESQSRQVIEGDRRIVFGKTRGQWIAMMYDYVNEAVPKDAWVKFSSPVVTTSVARVASLADTGVRIHVVEENLDVLEEEKERPKHTGWTAEVFLPWVVLGFEKRPGSIRCDFGVMVPDSGGVAVDRRVCWGDPAPAVSDLGIEAQIKPEAWGTLWLK